MTLPLMAPGIGGIYKLNPERCWRTGCKNASESETGLCRGCVEQMRRDSLEEAR